MDVNSYYQQHAFFFLYLFRVLLEKLKKGSESKSHLSKNVENIFDGFWYRILCSTQRSMVSFSFSLPNIDSLLWILLFFIECLRVYYVLFSKESMKYQIFSQSSLILFLCE